MTKRFYWFASSYVESDHFQDLRLRTALSSGPGYQFVERAITIVLGIKDLTLYARGRACLLQ